MRIFVPDPDDPLGGIDPTDIPGTPVTGGVYTWMPTDGDDGEGEANPVVPPNDPGNGDPIYYTLTIGSDPTHGSVYAIGVAPPENFDYPYVQGAYDPSINSNTMDFGGTVNADGSASLYFDAGEYVIKISYADGSNAYENVLAGAGSFRIKGGELHQPWFKRDWKEFKIHSTDVILVEAVDNDQALTDGYNIAHQDNPNTFIFKIHTIQEAIDDIRMVYQFNAVAGLEHPLDVTIIGHGNVNLQAMGSGMAQGDATNEMWGGAGPDGLGVDGTRAFGTGVSGMVSYLYLGGCNVAVNLLAAGNPNPQHIMNILALSLETPDNPSVTVTAWNEDIFWSPPRTLYLPSGDPGPVPGAPITFPGYFYAYATTQLWRAVGTNGVVVDYVAGS